MKLPFPKWSLVTKMKVYQEEEGENGITEKLIFNGKGNLSEKNKTVVNAEKQIVTLSGRCLLEGDILPGEQVKGYVEILNNDGTLYAKRKIYNANKPRNPDGSVYSTEIDLM